MLTVPAGLLIFGISLPLYTQEQQLNFSADFDSRSSFASCDGAGGGWGSGGGGSRGGGGSGGGCAPGEFFIQQSVGGYQHVIIRDQNDDFMLEWFIGGDDGGRRGGSRSGSSDAFERGSATRPLADSATGSGDPTRVHMRLILRDEDGGFESEYYKPLDERKPLMTQNITDGDLVAEFALDMRNSGFTPQTNVLGTMINRSTIAGLEEVDMIGAEFREEFGIPASGSFDVDTDAQILNHAVGLFTFSDGQYDYAVGEFDVRNINWIEFCDPAQNAHNCNIGADSTRDRDGRGGSSW